jgi:hypothetical protein
MTVQIPPLIGLLNRLRCLTLDKKTLSLTTQTPGFASLRIRVSYSLVVWISLGVEFDSDPLRPEKHVSGVE